LIIILKALFGGLFLWGNFGFAQLPAKAQRVLTTKPLQWFNNAVRVFNCWKVFNFITTGWFNFRNCLKLDLHSRQGLNRGRKQLNIEGFVPYGPRYFATNYPSPHNAYGTILSKRITPE